MKERFDRGKKGQDNRVSVEGKTVKLLDLWRYL